MRRASGIRNTEYLPPDARRDFWFAGKCETRCSTEPTDVLWLSLAATTLVSCPLCVVVVVHVDLCS